jgi:TonB family protein
MEPHIPYLRTIALFAILTVLSAFNSQTIHAQNVPKDAEPKVISGPALVLPAEVRAAQISGSVSILLSIDKTGTVKSAEVVAGPAWPCGTDPKEQVEIARTLAKNAMLAAKFSPKIKDGKPRDAEVVAQVSVSGDVKPQKNVGEPQSGAQKPASIQGGTLNGKARSLPKPEYPAVAGQNGIRGLVEIRVFIDESGKVVSAVGLSGNLLLQDAARSAACKASFRPTVLAGTPVKVTGIIVYNFNR